MSRGGFQHVLFTIDAKGKVKEARDAGDQVMVAVTASDDSIFIGRTTDSPPELRLAKLRPDFTIVWAKRFAAPSHNLDLRGAVATRDGGLAVVGRSEGGAFVVRLRSDGAVQWARELGPTGTEILLSVAESQKGALVCAGERHNQPWLVQLSASGQVAWQWRTRGAGGFLSVIETRDGDFVATGRSLLTARVSAAGVTRWQKFAVVPSGGNEFYYGSQVIETAQGALAIAANQRASNYVFVWNGDGSPQWQRRFEPGEGFFINAGGRGINLAPTSGGLLYAPTLGRSDPKNGESTTLVFGIDTDGRSACGWFSESNVTFADQKGSIEPVPVAERALTLDPNVWKLTLEPVELAASDVVCGASRVAAAPAQAVVPAGTSTFNHQLLVQGKARPWYELLKKKDFAQLDETAARLRARPWSDDPLYWDIDLFYTALSNPSVDLDENTLRSTLNEWMAARPKSMTPRIALALMLYDTAWKRRGGGYADSVGPESGAAYDRLLKEAAQTLTPVTGAEADPVYWKLRINFAKELGNGNAADIARLAAKQTQDPSVLEAAAHSLLPQWNGSLREYREFTEEAARLSKTTFGEGMYYWLAVRGINSMPSEPAAAAFDWNRMQQGARDIIRMAPQWLPSYHRFAVLAHRRADRVIARELFQRKELDWYEGAAQVWGSRAAYDKAREWALRPLTEPFAIAPPAAKPGNLKPVAPEPVPAAKLMKPEPGKQISPSPLLARPLSQWPQIVMENEITVAGEAKRRITSFLVETAKGIVAVSAVPDQTHPKDRGIANFQRRMSAWKMWSPEEPKRVMTVASIVTANAPNSQYGVAVALAPMKGKLPVHPLKPGTPPRVGSRVFVVACTWSSSGCAQGVIEGKIAFEFNPTGSTVHSYAVGIMARLERADLAGAPVLDEDGNVVAVMDGVESSLLSPSYGTVVAADDLANVLP